MKLTYYGYFLKHVGHARYLCNMQDFFKSFCDFNNSVYKNQFRYNDENVYLIHVTGRLFSFVQTKDKELVKKINASNISITEIHEALDQDESIGFASYVWIEKSYIGYGSTLLAPRQLAFVNFVNNIFSTVGIKNLTFSLEPLTNLRTKGDVVSMPFIGTSSVQVSSANSLFQDLVGMFGGEVEEFQDVDSFIVTIKSKRKQNIRKAASRVINSASDAGLEKMQARAKMDLHGALVDMVVEGKGAVSDLIDTENDGGLSDRIREKILGNQVLLEKVNEYEQHESFTVDNIESISGLDNAGAWADVVAHVQEAG